MNGAAGPAVWSRDGLIANGVQLAELGFGVVRVCYPLEAGGEWPCSEGARHVDRFTGTPCASPGKRPIGDAWQQQAEHDPERVRTLLGNPGNRSYGIVPPAGVFEWDIDGDAPERLRELAKTLGALPRTRVHRSGNGKHAFYRWPGAVSGGNGNLYGIVTRWLPGGMVVGPGSVHPSGRLYTVERDLPIAEFPEAWARGAASWSNSHHAAQDAAEPGEPDWKIPTDHRHPWLLRQVARLRGTGLRGEPLAVALLALNAERCDPPKGEAEVRRLADDYSSGKSDDGGGLNLDEPAPSGGGGPWQEPEDRGTATLSALGDVEYVADLIRPGRIVVVAAEEGAGKSYAFDDELGIRFACAGGLFAGTWEVLQTGGVLLLSEMHADDDYARESVVLASLGLERVALAGRYFRLPLMTAAGGAPALTVTEWRSWITGWCREHAVKLAIIDTATGATQVDPWGKEIQTVYRDLRGMLAEYPDLAVVLIVHVRKPTGHGERRLSDVLGEWGRWNDVTIMMENDGPSLERAKLTVRKRVRHERRIVVTKAGGLLVDPVDASAGAGPKVPACKVLAAVAEHPGLTYVELGAALGVAKDTASNYVKALGDQVMTARGGLRNDPTRVYPRADVPNGAEQAPSAPSSAPVSVPGDGEVPRAERTYIRSALGSAPSTDTPVTPDLVTEAARIFGDDLVDGAIPGADAHRRYQAEAAGGMWDKLGSVTDGAETAE